ncbi:hypothetical protein BpHYR1_043368 [Brachionus plicatilis]|uniref:Uncharacterized protein n=1 Tax=Brachionus plicatilis TaxID=10195 RepID=A0A3M7RHT7_BRAPC|nr:hypothetical protein BpHYR1_043368 [Brachionus plicatilis]
MRFSPSTASRWLYNSSYSLSSFVLRPTVRSNFEYSYTARIQVQRDAAAVLPWPTLAGSNSSSPQILSKYSNTPSDTFFLSKYTKSSKNPFLINNNLADSQPVGLSNITHKVSTTLNTCLGGNLKLFSSLKHS